MTCLFFLTKKSLTLFLKTLKFFVFLKRQEKMSFLSFLDQMMLKQNFQVFCSFLLQTSQAHKFFRLISLLVLLVETSPSFALRKQLDRFLIGVVVPLSGRASPLGKEVKLASELALKDFRRTNKRAGSHIRLVFSDDKGTEKGALEAAEGLKAKRAHLLIGSVFAALSQKLLDFSRQKNMPLIIPHPWRKGFKPSEKLAFSSVYPDHWEGFVLGKFAVESLKSQKTAIFINPTDRKAHDFAESFRRAQKLYHKKERAPAVLNLLYSDELLSFDELLLRAQADGVDTLLLSSFELEEAARLMEAYRRLGLKLPLLGPSVWRDPKLKELVPSSYGGHYYVNSFSAEAQLPSRVKNFIDEFEKKMKRRPGLLAAMAYDALQLAAHAFSKEGHTRRLAYHLSELVNVKGLMGPMHMGRKRARKSALILKTAQGLQERERVSSLVEFSKKDWQSKLGQKNRFRRR